MKKPKLVPLEQMHKGYYYQDWLSEEVYCYVGGTFKDGQRLEVFHNFKQDRYIPAVFGNAWLVEYNFEDT